MMKRNMSIIAFCTRVRKKGWDVSVRSVDRNQMCYSDKYNTNYLVSGNEDVGSQFE